MSYNKSPMTMTQMPDEAYLPAIDMLGIPIKAGDQILVYDVNRMNLETVFLCYNDSVIVDNDNNDKYNSRKCVVVTEQIESNEEKFPEYLI